MSVIDFLSRGLLSGIELAVETLNETNMEVSVIAITNILNNMKWMGKSNWATIYVESYLDNLRGNTQARIMGRMMRSEIFKIQTTNYKIIKQSKVNDFVTKWASKV